MMNPLPNDFSVTLFDHSALPFCIIKVELDEKSRPEDWTFVYCNDALAKLEGATKENLIGHRFFDVFPNGNRKWLKTYYEAAYENKAGVLDEISEEIGVFLHIDVFPTGHTGYCACMLKDVKEETIRKKETSYALTEALMKAESANRRKNTFLAHLSQDISLPAVEILSALEKAKTTEGDDKEESLDEIETLSHRLLRLSEEVMDMSQLESGQLKLAEEDFHFSHFLEDTLAPLYAKAAAKNQHLHLSLTDIQHEKVVGDPDRLGQVITNLMNNAIAYTQKEGQLKISIRELPLPQNGLCCYQFLIEDNGQGMSEAMVHRLSLPLAVDIDRATLPNSRGLGIPISQRIIRMMGGTMEIESELGEGSSVSFTIYLKNQPTTPPLHLLEDLSSMNYSGTEVLLIEHNELNGEIEKETLQILGLSVTLAKSGKEALEILKDKRFPLILTALQMPEMSGVDTAEAIRRLPSCEKAAIIGITSSPLPQVTAPAFTQIIPKPLDFYSIKEIMETYVKE